MGVTTKAELSYGYRLRANGGEWLVKEVHPDDSDEYGLNLDWLSEDDEDEFEDKATERLLAALADFTETDWRADGYFDRQREAKARLGVAFETTGWEGEDLLLVTKQYGAYLGEAEQIDPAALLAVSDDAAGERLRKALEVLGMTPLQERPTWLLTAYRG